MSRYLHCVLVSLLLFVAACGPGERCECPGSMLACGESACADGEGIRCSASGELEEDSEICAASCTPTTCAAAEASCGGLDDGCGGTLTCGSCPPGQRCGDARACVADPCFEAGAVCGSVEGVDCGSCPGDGVCNETRRACVEVVGDLPFESYLNEVVVAGERLFASGPTSKTDEYQLVELSLSSGATRSIHTAGWRITLSHNGTHLFWTDDAGLQRLADGASEPESIEGYSSFCNSLLATEATVFCGIGGNARYGVDPFGIRSLPVAGGTFQWLVRSLNYPRMSVQGGLLFYLGTTDNQYSFSQLGVVFLSDGFKQWLLSGGSLDSSFLLTDEEAYYFVERAGSASTLQRVGFEDTEATPLFVGSSFRSTSTVSTGAEVWTVGNIDDVFGLYRRGVAAESPPALWLSGEVLGGGDKDVHLFRRSDEEWILSVGTRVLRAFVP